MAMTTKRILIDNAKQLSPNLVLLNSALRGSSAAARSLFHDASEGKLVGFPNARPTGIPRLAKPRVDDAAESGAAVLNSWKEIASFLNRGVRTVQRWERELQLPIHRIGKGSRSPVFAFSAEIKLWLHSNKERVATEIPLDGRSSVNRRMPSDRRLMASWVRCLQLTEELTRLMHQHQLHTLRLAQNLENTSFRWAEILSARASTD